MRTSRLSDEKIADAIGLRAEGATWPVIQECLRCDHGHGIGNHWRSAIDVARASRRRPSVRAVRAAHADLPASIKGYPHDRDTARRKGHRGR